MIRNVTVIALFIIGLIYYCAKVDPDFFLQTDQNYEACVVNKTCDDGKSFKI